MVPVVTMPVFTFVAFTVALGMAAPDGSVTVPPTTAFTCALAGRTSEREHTSYNATIKANRFTILLLSHNLPAAHERLCVRMYAFTPVVEDYILGKRLSTIRSAFACNGEAAGGDRPSGLSA